MRASLNQSIEYDALIVGGSYAGLSAAMTLGRSLRRVLVIDSGKPCNRQTSYAHGLLTRDGESPAELTRIAQEQVLAYPSVTIVADLVVSGVKIAGGFSVKTVGGRVETARKLLIATGMHDIMPDIDGFAACWGISVLHCPYCHGYEVSNQPLGVLGNETQGHHLTRLIQNWSKDITLFANGPAHFTPQQQADIDRLSIPIIESPVVKLTHNEGMLQRIQTADGSSYALLAMFAPVPVRQASDLAQQLGCEMTETGYIKIVEFGQTTVAGVFAAGDNSFMIRQVGMAMANGSMAGARLNASLIDDDLAWVMQPISA